MYTKQKADSSLPTIRLISLVIQEGFEPPTHGLEVCSQSQYLSRFTSIYICLQVYMQA